MKLDAEADQNVQLSLHFVPEWKRSFYENQVWVRQTVFESRRGSIKLKLVRVTAPLRVLKQFQVRCDSFSEEQCSHPR
jgi:hypothetical protein